MQKNTISARLLAVIVFICCVAGCGRKETQVPLSQRIPNREAVVLALRKGLKEHAKELTVTFRTPEDVSGELPGAAAEWMEEALAVTEDPAEGDYLRFQYGGYETKTQCLPGNTGYDCEIVIIPKYYSCLYQDEEALRMLADVAQTLRLTSDDEPVRKLERIYAYVCETVSYDVVHAGKQHHTLRSTAFSAMHYHKATCQGYCAVIYYLCKSAGINCRIVSGTAGGEAHTWNLVELDGVLYALDATWDAGADEYRFFLKGSEELPDHVKY